MRRAEMARRRKNLSEKRNEEEKVFLPLKSYYISFSPFLFLLAVYIEIRLTPEIIDGHHQQTPEKTSP